MDPASYNVIKDIADERAGDERTGLVFIDEFGHRRDYRFAEIFEQSLRYAAVLFAFGVARGDRVLMRTSNTAKSAFTLLGLARLGAVPVLCVETMDDAKIAALAQTSGAACIVANRRHVGAADALRRQMPGVTRHISIGEERDGWSRLDSLVTRAAPHEGIELDANDCAIVVEGEQHSREDLDEARAAIVSANRIVSSDVVWCSAPFGSALWFEYALFAPWSRGAATVLHEGSFEPRERLDLVRELDVTVLIQSAREYAAELQIEEPLRFRHPRLRRCEIDADSIEPDLADRWQSARGLSIEPAARVFTPRMGTRMQ